MDASRSAMLAACCFALLAGALVWILSRDLRPPPLYPSLTAAGSVQVPKRSPVSLEWTVAAPPSALVVPAWLGGEGKLGVRLSDASAGRELSSAWLGASDLLAEGVVAVPLLDVPATARRLRVEFFSSEPARSQAPVLTWSPNPPGGNASVQRGGTSDTSGGPLLLVEYPWPSRNLLWFWLGLPPLTLVVRRSRRGMPALLVTLGLLALATSVLLWQRDYSRNFGHWDADEFGTYATMMARYLTAPASRAAGRDWMAFYIHAHNPLGPALMALPIAAGLPMHLVYVGMSAACSFLALLIVYRMLRRELGASESVALAIVVLYGCQLIFLRSFARPVTDALGHLLSVATIALLLGRATGPVPAQLWGLAALNLLHPLARPQGLAYLPFVTAAVMAMDAARETARRLRAAGHALLVLGLLPVTFLLAIFVLFGWFASARALLDVAGQFWPWFMLHDFAWSLAGVLQLVPVIWLAAGTRWWDRRALVLAGWVVYCTAVLVAVRAPLWMRHFLPVLPGVMGLAALALERCEGRRRGALFALVAALCVVNVALVVHFIVDRANLSLRLLSTIVLG